MANRENRKETDWEEVHRILEELKDADVFEKILALEGTIHFTESLESIREDRDLDAVCKNRD
jgi:hypothetical protein